MTQATHTPAPNPPPTTAPKEEPPVPQAAGLFIEQIPGSLNHSPDATWWGYNQSKIARIGDIVFMFVVENDNDPSTESRFVIYKKEGEGGWQSGAVFPTSRPGNIVVDSKGGLHAFVFDPLDVLENDSLGTLEHYHFPDAYLGNISDYQHERVIDNDGRSGETVNIRTGVSIGPDDSIAVAFGLTEGNGFRGHTEQVHYKGAGDDGWARLIAGENLGHDFYYSFPLVTDFGLTVLAIQDDPPDTGDGNFYQIASYFEYVDNTWSQRLLVDNTGHPDAASRPRLVEISDNYQDTAGNIHLLVVDHGSEEYRHFVRDVNGAWTVKVVPRAYQEGVNWIRLIEVNGEVYYLAATWNRVLAMKESGDRFVSLDLQSKDVEGIYLYVSAPRTGTSPDSAYIDMLLLNGSSETYPNGRNHYLRVSKQYLADLVD